MINEIEDFLKEDNDTLEHSNTDIDMESYLTDDERVNEKITDDDSGIISDMLEHCGAKNIIAHKDDVFTFEKNGKNIKIQLLSIK